MTGQSLLDMMELLNRELQLQNGEVDVTRGLLALNTAQDLFESLYAQFPTAESTTGTITTTANTETTTFPAGVLRIDRLQFIDPVTALPAWDLSRITKTGGHRWNLAWPFYILSTQKSGRPTAYWEDRHNLYWSPIPDATHTVRWYGLKAAPDITASGTFAWPDSVALPIAAAAVQLFRVGLDDEGSTIEGIKNQYLAPAVQALLRHNRDGAVPFTYTTAHEA